METDQSPFRPVPGNGKPKNVENIRFAWKCVSIHFRDFDDEKFRISRYFNKVFQKIKLFYKNSMIFIDISYSN